MHGNILTWSLQFKGKRNNTSCDECVLISDMSVFANPSRQAFIKLISVFAWNMVYQLWEKINTTKIISYEIAQINVQKFH